MDNLLVNLRKYRPREQADPLENFITEAFAWLLRGSEEVREELLKLMNEHLDVPVPYVNADVVISTQENFRNKFPDMVLRWPEWLVVFEHKIWSELHDDQLKNYRNYAIDTVGEHKHRIILITAKKKQHKQDPDAALCWEQIYKRFELICESVTDVTVSWAIKDFLELLKAEGLGPSTPINKFSLAHYTDSIALDEQLNNICANTLNEQWPLKNEGWQANKKKKCWGRIGIEFNTSDSSQNPTWEPGVFCGFMVDDSDHQIQDLMGKGLLGAVVLDLSEEAQTKIDDLLCDIYNDFVTELTNKIIEYNAGWEVSNRRDPLVHNPWHPLFITKTIESMFDEAHTTDDQESKFFSQISDLQKVLLSCSSFAKLKYELKRRH